MYIQRQLNKLVEQMYKSILNRKFKTLVSNWSKKTVQF